MKNTPSVIYSICNSCNLHWKRRKIELSNIEHNKWIDDPSFNSCYILDSDTITIVSVPIRCTQSKYVVNKQQYIHGGVNATDEKFSTGIVLE